MNEDYFGKEIYDANDPSVNKHKAVAGYIAKQLTGHPWLKAALDAKDDPGYQTITKALELPIRYYKTESIQNAPFWDKYNEAKVASERLQKLRYSNPEEAVDFYEANKNLIDSKEIMAEKVGAYFDNNKDSRYLQGGGVVQGDGHMAFVGADGKFHLIDTNFDIPIPQLTGLEELDKKIISSYKSDISSKKNNVLTLWENGIITANQAENILQRLELGYQSVSEPKKGKKAPLMTLKKLPSSSYKPSKVKISLPNLASSKAKLKVAPPKVNVLQVKRETI